MQDQKQSIIEKIERLQKAHADGRLYEYEVVKTMCDDDSAAASSWGPAMRR